MEAHDIRRRGTVRSAGLERGDVVVGPLTNSAIAFIVNVVPWDDRGIPMVDVTWVDAETHRATTSTVTFDVTYDIERYWGEVK